MDNRGDNIIEKNIPIIAFLLSGLIFLFIYGYSIVDPSHINWIMAGDPSQHFLGWHFFRTEAWHFPLGLIEKYHAPSGTCMVYMDAIPLIGLPLKIFSDFLPQPFQYLGLWLMGSYMLQGFFASLILKRFTDDWRLILLGTTFFILSPIMFFRAGSHEALAGHWLILAALYLYLSPIAISTRIKWIVLILIGSMVHFYLLVMVLAIWVGYLLKELLSKTSIKIILFYFVITMSLLLLTMWVFGYFTIAVGSTETSGFGKYSMNILAPFNPAGGGETTFLHKIKFATSGQYEGYNYLGIGVFILMVASIFKLPKAIKRINSKVTLLPIVIVMILLFIYSLSGKVTLGSEILFEFQYPWILNDLSHILRASGRMFWPVHYVLIIISLFIVFKYYKPKIALAILAIALLLQAIDLYPWYSSRNLGNRTYKTTLKSKDWEKIATAVKHIVMIPPNNNRSDRNNHFALYAANNKLDINLGYVAREDMMLRSKYYEKIMTEFENNKLRNNTLYIVNKSHLILPSSENIKKYSFGSLDGYKIIIPKTLKIKLGSWIDNISTEKILFNSKKVIFDSWSHAEKTFRWSLGNASRIFFKIKEPSNFKGLLTLDIGALGEQRVELIINGHYIGTKIVSTPEKRTIFSFDPKLLHRNKLNIIEFKFPDARQPGNGDQRLLAIAIRSFRIE